MRSLRVDVKSDFEILQGQDKIKVSAWYSIKTIKEIKKSFIFL